MSAAAIAVKFAPVFDHGRFTDPAWRADRTMYQRLELPPGKTTIPLLVDHGRQIGTIDQLYRMDWTDGRWWTGSGAVTDPPSWLKRGSRASFEFASLDRRDVSIRGTTADLVAHGLVTEVSVLSLGVEPAEPRAEVLLLTDSPAVRTSDRTAAGDVDVVLDLPLPRVLARRFYPTRIEVT